MANITKVDEQTYLHLDGNGDIVWQGWLYRFHDGATAKERNLRAYQPRTVAPVPGMPGRFQDSLVHPMYVAQTGRTGEAKWAVVLYGDTVATAARKGDAQYMLRDLLGLGR
jgi:hypothetical protein